MPHRRSPAACSSSTGSQLEDTDVSGVYDEAHCLARVRVDHGSQLPHVIQWHAGVGQILQSDAYPRLPQWPA